MASIEYATLVEVVNTLFNVPVQLVHTGIKRVLVTYREPQGITLVGEFDIQEYSVEKTYQRALEFVQNYEQQVLNDNV